MLLVCKLCKYQPPLTNILSHFVQVFNYLSKVLKIYMYSGIHINKSLLVILCVKKLCRRSSVILQSQHLKNLEALGHTIMSTLFISVFLMRIKFVLTGFFCFSPSQAVIIAVANNKRQKCPFLKEKIQKKFLEFQIKTVHNVTCVIG